MEMPQVDSAEWKKLPSGLEVWDAKEGDGDAVKPGAHRHRSLHRLADQRQGVRFAAWTAASRSRSRSAT